ncbi:uncharacterized protein LOC114351977 isoform X1 [Ostrinia furnacalis]|uniref:uncharacterized protein LOC114351977 isoform X1 n=1 Tax=Ostrinia furnacalis TaxID=93504 RepID=UPI00103CECD8|nr:uncharacterized protein LOC114351977 isoform X1 [Ostrinia furnacalis]
MAYTKTVLSLLLVNIVITNCQDDIRTQNYNMDDIQADLLRSNDQEYRHKDIEPEKSMMFEDTDRSDDRPTTVDYTTTEVPEDNKSEEVESEDEAVTPTELPTDTVENTVYRTKAEEDIYLGDTQHAKDTKTEATTQWTTRPMDEMEDFVPRIAELGDDLEITGQRSPKTDNTDPKTLIDKRNFEVKPRPTPVVSKSSTLKSWLEDTWTRPPAGLLVPLRPMALNRALAVWSDLTVEGLNVSDIVIVGYDSNGVNWRSRHSLQPSSTGRGDRAVTEALSKLLLKYQGVNSDASGDGTMRALASAAKLVPYDSALFVVTDKGAGDPQRLPLALRALIEKRLKVYTIWTDPNHPSTESEAELQELRNVSLHTEGEVLPYSLQVMDMETSSNLASEAELQEWDPMDSMVPTRHGRLNSHMDDEKFETLLVRRGGGEAISLGVPVDNGVTALRVYIEGAVEHAVLYPPNDAPQIDLYNTSSVSAFSPASKTEGLMPRDVLLVFPGVNLEEDILSVIPATPVASDAAMVGTWHLSVRCDTCDYRLCVGARAQLHFGVEETDRPDKLKFRITGPVASVRESVLIDEYGLELAKLPYSYPPMTRDPEHTMESPVADLVADVQIPSVKGSRVYAKIVGRDTKGEPFARLAGPLLHQSEVRMGRSAALVFPDSKNDLEAAEEANSRIYNERLELNDNVTPYNRAVSQVVNQRGTILTAVQIGLGSRLYGAPGDNLQLHFEVTNYRDQSVSFRFRAVGEQRFLRGISPLQDTIQPGQTLNVVVSLFITATATPGLRDFITFSALSTSGDEQVSISSYVYVMSAGTAVNDVWPPEVRHNFQGSCIGRMGDDCAQHVWSASIIARDANAGLLRLTSTPIGLSYDSNFVAGSRSEVNGVYRATCCAPRVVVTAVDALGNANSYVIDISSYITEAGIAAIVLGVFLFIFLIILIVLLIVWCVRRRKESRELPYSTSSRNIS